ncbi:L domain-like protein [Suhomyces tanzawaensis NRRL Y-17324]|uniref:L domain-like protein n=1 Tax=Suhomyces tanzawaensis NRRL Y-17324 TaxID=984487 RepID=A0A1E4SL47_9ASCO|nr:L domain-like protein [Suhomyces tanzawaensis NRRL Y-17324]ODV80210.1 L domain-like protein [Suhomyces tanzawaensis NRRL Y-17324]
MEKQNPLLPFAFSGLSYEDNLPLNTSPRDRKTIDQNASSQYHTRTSQVRKRPVLNFTPTLKRKMGESFNEKDDVKRRDMDFGSDPTIIDEDQMDDDEKNFSNTNDGKYGNMLPPSSPPLEESLMSEFDFTTDPSQAYGLPDSPKPLNHPHPDLNQGEDFSDFPSEVDFLKPENRQPSLSQTYSPQKGISKHFSSDADFGIDHFNRFKNPSANGLPSSDVDRGFEELKISSFNKARDYIIEAFEEIRTTINLENMDLYDVPDEIKDLNNLVIFDYDEPVSYQLYLTGNKLRELPPSLFKFTKLNVLGLRLNKLVKIPPSIGRLVNLVDLSLASNRLEFLPYQILNLPKLQTFRAGPNPYLPIPDDAIAVSTSTFNQEKQKVYVSQMKYLAPEAKQSTLVPSLKSFCLNQVAKYDVSYQETKTWKKNTPKLYHNLIIQAITKGKYDETCCECDIYVVEPFAEVIEWWNFLKNKNVPFKRQFCSGGCVKNYQSRFINELNEFA